MLNSFIRHFQNHEPCFRNDLIESFISDTFPPLSLCFSDRGIWEYFLSKAVICKMTIFLPQLLRSVTAWMGHTTHRLPPNPFPKQRSLPSSSDFANTPTVGKMPDVNCSQAFSRGITQAEHCPGRLPFRSLPLSPAFTATVAAAGAAPSPGSLRETSPFCLPTFS